MGKLQERRLPVRKKTSKSASHSSSSKGTLSSTSPTDVKTTEGKLPVPELAVYLTFVVITFSTAFYNVYISSQEHVEAFSSYMLERGWSIFGNSHKDVADFEWSYWHAMVTPVTILLTLGHIILGRVVEKTIPKWRKHFIFGYGMVSLLCIFGAQAVLVFILYTLAAYLASRTKSAVVVWAVILLEILSTNTEFFSSHLTFLFPNEELFNHVVFSTAMCQLRLLSYCLEYCKSTKRTTAATQQGYTNENWDFFSVMSYNFYFPLFATGPVMTFDKFSQQINKSPRPFSKEELKRILKEFMRYIFWAVFADVVLHFLYFPSFHQVWYKFQFLPTWSLGGIGLCHLLFFQIKYVVTYGIPRTIALFDRVEAPLPPACVLSIYTFQDMWRYFDRGLNSLLISTIYIPVGGSQRGFLRQLLASMLCFSFVFFWHGVEVYLLYWALINWLGVVVEITAQKAVEQFGILTFLNSKMSPSAVFRVLGLFLTLNYMLLALSNLVFLGGQRVAYTYYHRIIVSGWPWPLLTFFCTFYSVLQLTRALHQHFGKSYLCKKVYAV
ncbi:protein-cysteine N-palmitoyltransferase HHAT-like [Asterias amurensis]|uniref:protein-cysteine N-palmitoyltransferase HHAT-like n=1 Tax=Asterias amurensis TaxID=7602 RepID=UPI003AB80F7A